ncbi:MAG: hypothetical protein M3310_06585 [Actinomycetota bacterium]|nr:hypothetical protein [Actinomycetota bacterium]
MRRRWIWILLIVLAAAVAAYLIGYELFNMGETEPGSGTGEILTGPTTP